MGRDAVGELELDPATGGNRELPEGTAEVPEGYQEHARGPAPRQQDEGVSRLPPTLCRPQARGSERQVGSEALIHPLSLSFCPSTEYL